MTQKHNYLLSVCSGIFLSLPWLQAGLGWILFFAFLPLLWAEDEIVNQRKENSIPLLFSVALPAFLIWNALSTWSLAYVSLAGMFLYISINALLMGVVWWLRHLFRRQFGSQSVFFLLPVFWLTLEFLQHNWMIQMPWLTLGNGFANAVKIIQWYEFTGVLGGSLWILLSNMLIFSLIKTLKNRDYLKSAKFAAYTLFMILIPLFWSLALYSSYEEKGANQSVLILQPNVDPYTEKFSGISSGDQVKRLVSLAGSNLTDSTDLILAPETALPEMWEDSIHLQNHCLDSFSAIFLKYPDLKMIAGAMTLRKFGKDENLSETARQSADGAFSYDIYNSALLFDRTSEIQICHKSILVSGVEKIPFQKYFSFLEKYAIRIGGTSGSLGAAMEPVLFKGKEDVKIGPVICFESAFGEHCGKLVRMGANVLVVITNDGWWKDSPGTWQHFGYSRLRAIETRRSIARSANTGISGFINQRGDVMKKTRLNTIATLSSSIRLNDSVTFYTRNGDWPGRLSVLLSGMVVVYLFLKIKGKKNPH